MEVIVKVLVEMPEGRRWEVSNFEARPGDRVEFEDDCGLCIVIDFPDTRLRRLKSWAIRLFQKLLDTGEGRRKASLVPESAGP